MLRRYFIVYLSTILVSIAIVLMGSLIIDPYGVSPLRVSIEGVNVVKPSRNRIDVLIKPFDVLGREGDAVFLGSSRIKRGLDPKVIQEKHGWRVYNLGIDDHKVSQSAEYVEFIARHSGSPTTLFVEVYGYLLPAFAYQDDTVVDLGFGSLFANALKLTLSRSALVAQLDTLRNNALAIEGFYTPPFTDQNGFFNANLPNDIGLGFSNWADFVWLKHPLADIEVPHTVASFLLSLQREAMDKGMDIKFFLTPQHPIVLYTYEMYGAWDEVETVKRQLAEVGGVYDFMRYNYLTNEPLRPRMTYWRDTNHFSQEMGEKIVQRLMGLTGEKTLPENFGVLLTPETIERDLVAFRSERETWAKANPDIVRRYHGSWADHLAKQNTAN